MTLPAVLALLEPSVKHCTEMQVGAGHAVFCALGSDNASWKPAASSAKQQQVNKNSYSQVRSGRRYPGQESFHLTRPHLQMTHRLSRRSRVNASSVHLPSLPARVSSCSEPSRQLIYMKEFESFTHTMIVQPRPAWGHLFLEIPAEQQSFLLTCCNGTCPGKGTDRAAPVHSQVQAISTER